jgi:hypothetical protein
MHRYHLVLDVPRKSFAYTHQAANKNAIEHLRAQWRTSTLTTAVMNCLVGTDFQTGRATDESDIWQPQNEEYDFSRNMLCHLVKSGGGRRTRGTTLAPCPAVRRASLVNNSSIMMMMKN